MNGHDQQQFSFNIHAELYENDFGDLAIRFEGDRVYSGMSNEHRFQDDARQFIEKGELPAGWQEMPPHQLLYGHNWQCVSRLGYIDGDFERPAVEFEVEPEALGAPAKNYLADLLH